MIYKNPKCLEQYLGDFQKDNTILLTTLETNRDEGYDKISKAPVPSKRYADFKALPWNRKIVTIEPIMDFDHETFLRWITDLKPEAVWIGYNSRPKQVRLPEPPLEKTKKFIAALKTAGIEVKEKEMREEKQIIREKYSEAYKPWSRDEDESLIESYCGVGIEEAIEILYFRTPKEIHQRIKELKLDEEMKADKWEAGGM